MAEEPTGAEGAEETEDKSTEETHEDDFDKERALKTIRAQREDEKKLKAELAKYRAAEEAELEKQKSLDQKIADRDVKIQNLETELSNLQVETAFKQEAREKGIMDPDLAFLAAKEAGLLAHDPETGKVEFDFDQLAERFPTFAPKEGGAGVTGDAGRRGSKGKKSPGQVFNDEVRGAMQRRL